MKKNNIKTLSLFSGAGGLDIGFHQAGFDVIACVELEEKYCKSLVKNKEQGKYVSTSTNIHNIDIRDFDISKYVDAGIECIIGGPPCQTFSAAGRRAGGVIGTDDERGQLYETYCKILDAIKPEVFVFENVYGLPGANGGGPWREIQKAFTEHGYDLTTEVVDAADYGVPQHRERLIMIGTKGHKFKFPIPTVGPDSLSQEPLTSVYNAIEDLQKKKEKFSDGLGGLYGHLLPDVPEGLNYAFFTAEMGHPEPVFAWRSKFHDLLYKVNRDRPCRTLKASPGKFTGPFHWKNRHFTIEELKRLQTFPDDYEIVGSYGKIVEQIGNSVPPRLAQVIAESIKEQILRPSDSLKHKLRTDEFVSTFRKRQRERSKEFKNTAQKAIKKQYGCISKYNDDEPVKPSTSKFYSAYDGLFTREEFSKKPSSTVYFESVLTESNRFIRLDLDQKSKVQPESHIEVSISVNGLSKYLPKFDKFKLSASVQNMQSLFSCWKEIELALINRSKFFTLIDIYGHYANRGDVVDVTMKITAAEKTPILEMIEYFSQTINCGGFEKEEELTKLFALSKSELYDYITIMRELRYDIRTYDSHPIIGKGNVLCTYPFPLLSPKALVNSRVKLNREKIDERQTKTA
jgi:DNA (cytosine-5)-methyltransferase 1